MFVKDGMTRTAVKFFENDYLQSTAELLLDQHLKGGLVYSFKDELIGCFTEHHVLKGLVTGKKYLSQILVSSFTYLNEMDEIKNTKFAEYEILPVQNNNGKIVGFLTKNQYNAALAKATQSEINRLECIVKCAHSGIVSIDLEGKITFINPHAEKMAKTLNGKAAGQFLNDVVVPSGLLNVIRTGKGHTEKYQVGKRKYLTHRTPIYDGKQLIGAVGVFQDISEIEFISNELESVKQILKELDTIMNSISDGICITDPKGNIIKCNQLFKELFFGRSKKREYSQMIQEIIHQILITGKRHHRLEASLANPLIIKGIPIKNKNRVIERIVIHVKDMTEIDGLRKELEQTKSILMSIRNPKQTGSFIAKSQEMMRLVGQIEQVAKTDVTVLLSGESGVGKEEAAKLIQQSSLRAEQPYIKVNCGAIPESLIESELFGYEGGSFTGALKQGKIGLFEQANNGTIFLDEIGELPPQLQVKLLRVLQEMEITRVGAAKPIKIDVRIIAATNKDLQEMVINKEFREDLFYRLNVIPISLPPLRSRVEDIPLLVDLYSEMLNAKYSKHLQFSKEALQVLTNYHWPGNVRELINILERIYVTTHELLIKENEVLHILGDNHQNKHDDKKAIIVNKILPLKVAVDELEKELIFKVSQVEKSFRGIARVLEVNPSTILRKVRKLKGVHQIDE